MNINEKISQNLNKYDSSKCPKYIIKEFIEYEGEFLSRQEKAIRIIESIMDIHGKKHLHRYITQLARIEHGIRELEPWVRDHVVHAVLSYVLGLYINDNFIGSRFGFKVPNFQWKIAGLFHDIGYPVEISNSILKSYSDEINKLRQEINIDRPCVSINISLHGIEELTNDQNSFLLIQKCLDDWKLDIQVKSVYNEYQKSGRICHGMISALTLVNIIDLLYQKYNPRRHYLKMLIPGTNIDVNQIYFENDIVPACSAIFIHNLPSEYFKGRKIDLKNAPIAYLLKLSDCLQEWERPSGETSKGYSSNKFDISIKSDLICFKADIPDERKKKITDDINNTLCPCDILIS